MVVNVDCQIKYIKLIPEIWGHFYDCLTIGSAAFKAGFQEDFEGLEMQIRDILKYC